jgi:DNA-nicking Smr family endonuclease
MPRPPSDDEAPADDEARAFGEAMRGARRLGDGPRRVSGAPRPSNDRRAGPSPAPARLAMETTEGGAAGRAPDVSAALLGALRRGEPRAEARVDLHGRKRDQALRAAETFLQRARAEGRRAVLVIHGRGNGSDGGEAVLRPALQAWLGSAEAARAGVMAFAPAPARDGGAGATLILLRR